MKRLVLCSSIVLLAKAGVAGSLSAVLPGTTQDELIRLKSPAGSSLAILVHKERHWLGLPPEPPKTTGRWARLKVDKASKVIYNSGYEDLNVFQSNPGFALDLEWSPDSEYVAYRFITALRIIGPHGQATSQAVAPEGFSVTSFKWIDKTSLLVVSKKARYPLDVSGTPFLYNGYTDQAKSISIARLDLTKGMTERYRAAVSDPTFLFHSVGFIVDEISPHADRVAFSDGANVSIYDDTAGRLITTVAIPQKPAPARHFPADYPPEIAETVREMSAEPAQLEGLWWQNNDRLLLGVGLLGFPAKSFYIFDISTNKMNDVTGSLLPIWNGSDEARNFRDANWYRSVIK